MAKRATEPQPDGPELLGWPYRAPRCKVGAVLACRIRGDMTVAGLTDAPVPWPWGWQPGIRGGGKRLLIVCQDLERAIRTESTTALCHHWAVSRSLVTDWKRALGVPRVTPGALKVLRDTIGRHFGPDDLAAGGRAAAEARVRNRKAAVRAAQRAARKAARARKPPG